MTFLIWSKNKPTTIDVGISMVVIDSSPPLKIIFTVRITKSKRTIPNIFLIIDAFCA